MHSPLDRRVKMEVRGHGTQLLLGLNLGVIFYMSHAPTCPAGYLQIRKSLETRKTTDHRNLVLQERKPRTSVGVCAVVEVRKENHRLQTPSTGQERCTRGTETQGNSCPGPVLALPSPEPAALGCGERARALRRARRPFPSSPAGRRL